MINFFLQTMSDMFSLPFLVRAFIVGLLVSLCASLLGVSLVLKRYSMIGDGLSHVGFGALAAATALQLAPLVITLPVVVIAAFLLLRLRENSKIKGDAAIAMISTGALAIGVIIISQTTGMNTDVCNYLFGTILATSKSDVYLSVALCVLVLALFVLFYNAIFAITFDETFAMSCGLKTNLCNMLIAFLTAVTIVLGMRMMGAMLISSVIIFPALTSMRIFKKFRSVTICSAVIAVTCYFFGLVISYLRSTPTGASVVVLNIIAFILFSLINIVKQKYKLYKSSGKKIKICALSLLILSFSLSVASCERSLGWGVLLWASEDAGIPSGTVMRVYIKSNIEKVWVAGVPDEYKSLSNTSKIEVPIPMLELCGSKAAAQKRVDEFGEYRTKYAETLQDGLPIRDNADNSARRIYRLRAGEMVKILKRVDGTPAISGTGDPLPGDWLLVLCEDGTQGYCFSYRLRVFDHTIGEIVSSPQQKEDKIVDKELDEVLAETWIAQIYGDMINNNKLDVDALSKHWGFDIGEESGIAKIHMPDIDQTFKYARIAAEGNKTWYFEGSTLRMHLRSPSILVVSFVDVTGSVSSEIKMAAGSQRTLLFINTTTSLDDLITQEKTRQHELYRDILLEGPNFSSEHYGTLYFTEGGEFRWDDYDLLIPSILPVAVLGRGRVETKYFLANSLKNDYAGVLTMILKTIGGPDQTVNFLYSLDSGGGLGGLRLEYLPQWCLEDNTAVVKDNSPTVMYFYQVE